MAYNGFPITYPQLYPQPQFTPQMPQNQGNTGLIWVSGIAGAKAYLVAPNTTVQLWDSEAQTVYLKSADASGMPSIKILDYTIRDEKAPSAPLYKPAGDYATQDDIKALRAEIDSLKARIKGDRNESDL